MPSKQRGTIDKLVSGRWAVRYYDEHDKRRRAGASFPTKTAAAAWLTAKTAIATAAYAATHWPRCCATSTSPPSWVPRRS